MISPEIISQIKEAVRIEEVVGEFVTLRRRGANLLGCCPFHNEKTPSFTVSPAKNIFKCFGCGESGGAIDFVIKHEHLSYPDALRFLAKKYNIEIVEEKLSEDQIKQAGEREAMLHVSSFAQKYFAETLFNTEQGKAIGLSYFLERGFTEATIQKFGLGYCLDEWEAFTQHAVKNGYKTELLIKTGLTISKENGKHFDRFKGRIMFPIHSLTGQILGFGGRILSTDKTKAKYVNSPESEIYNKSKILYGLYFAKKSIVAQNRCYLVEGYADVISMHQSGIENVVASSGTSLTVEQIKLIKRYTPNITILYDGDAAGIKASFRGIDMILEQDMNVEVVLFPDGEDPDSFAQNHSQTEVVDFIAQNSQNFIRFKSNILLKEAGNDPIKKANLIRDIIESIAVIPDGISRSMFVKECAELMRISEQVLLKELNKLLGKKLKKDHQEQTGENIDVPEIAIPDIRQPETPEKNVELHEREIIRLLLFYGNQKVAIDKKQPENEQTVAELIVSDLLADEIEFETTVYQKFFKEYEQMIQQHIPIADDSYFLNHENEEIKKTSIDIIQSKPEISPNWWELKRINILDENKDLYNTIRSGLLYFKSRKLEKTLFDLRLQVKAYENGNPNQISEDDFILLLRDVKLLREILVQVEQERNKKILDS